MKCMKFSIQLLSKPNDVFAELINFKNMPKLLPRQLKKIEIISEKENQILTRETLVFKTIVKNEIIQECMHEIYDKEIKTIITSGPAKNSIINMKVEGKEGGTYVEINIDLKLSLKAKILRPIVKKVYSNLLTGVLYKIDTLIEEGKSN
jgi:ribosome-associated toxin RatA of RatAB toxin-antitoxin module